MCCGGSLTHHSHWNSFRDFRTLGGLGVGGGGGVLWCCTQVAAPRKVHCRFYHCQGLLRPTLEGNLGVIFFFFLGVGDLSNFNKSITTLARRLVTSVHDTRRFIYDFGKLSSSRMTLRIGHCETSGNTWSFTCFPGSMTALKRQKLCLLLTHWTNVTIEKIFGPFCKVCSLLLHSMISGCEPSS